MWVAGALANVCQEVSRQKHRWGEQGLGYVDRGIATLDLKRKSLECPGGSGSGNLGNLGTLEPWKICGKLENCRK